MAAWLRLGGALGLLSLVLAGCGGGGQTPVPGGESRATIGPQGGSLRSADGRLSVRVPAGALAAPTELSVEGLQTSAPHGLASYRLLPEGLSLAQPVELSLNYASGTLAAEDPSVAAVLARRDAAGRWLADFSTRQDRAAHTLTLATRRFGDFAWAEAVRLAPAASRVPVGGGLDLSVNVCTDPPTDDPSGMLAPLTEHCAPSSLGTLAQGWAVNGRPGGDVAAGTVLKAEGDAARAHYSAPPVVPDPNPVAVSVDWGVGTASVKLVSSVAVTDQPSLHCDAARAPRRWNGYTTAEMLVNGLHESLRVEVSFLRDELDPSDPGPCTYHVEGGTLRWSLNDTQGGCTYRGGPLRLPIRPEDGSLMLDTATAPFGVSATGGTSGMATVNVSCPDGQHSYQTVAGIGGWLTVPPGARLSADGQHFTGEYASGDNRWTWDLSAQD